MEISWQVSIGLTDAGDVHSQRSHDTELGNGIGRPLAIAQSLGSPYTSILSPSPKDPLIAFMCENQTSKELDRTAWKLEPADLESFPESEVKRQVLLHAIIASESHYLQSLQAVRVLYKYRLILDSSMMAEPNSSNDINNIFPSYENMYYANKTLLYEPLKSRQSSEGPKLSAVWDIIRNWWEQSKYFYINYALYHPIVKYAVQREAKQNIRFSRLIYQSGEHRLGAALDWDSCFKAPFTRMKRYLQLLHMVLLQSDESNPRHRYRELEELIEELSNYFVICKDALYQIAKIKTIKLLSLLEDAGQLILLDDSSVCFDENMFYGEKEGSKLQDMLGVAILVIREPESIVVLRRVYQTGADRSTAEVLVEVRVPGPFRER